MSIDQETIDNIVKNGTYYNPAYNHYGYVTSVKCDKCNRAGINVCIGWEKYDLCMACVDLLTTKKPDLPKPRNLNDGFNGIYTLMMQSQFKPRPTPIEKNNKKLDEIDASSTLSFMMQEQFKQRLLPVCETSNDESNSDSFDSLD